MSRGDLALPGSSRTTLERPFQGIDRLSAQSAMLCPCQRTASASRLRRRPSHSGQASSISSHSIHESSTLSSAPVRARSSLHSDVVDLQAGAVARRAPAVLGVVREETRVELGEAAAAGSGTRAWWRRSGFPSLRRRARRLCRSRASSTEAAAARALSWVARLFPPPAARWCAP